MAYRNYSPAVGIIVDKNGHGDFTTVQAAVTAAVSGQSVYVNDGIYTENITAKPGVLITGFSGTGYAPNVIIKGNITCSSAGNYAFGAIQLETNAGFLLTVSGSASVAVQINNCYINCNDHTGISFTNSNAASVIAFYDCSKNLAANGAALYSMSSPGTILIFRCDLQNSGVSTTASTNSAGIVGMFHCAMSSVHSVSGAGFLNLSNCRLDTTAVNTTSITLSGTSLCNVLLSELFSGTASCIVVGAGCTLGSAHITAASSNTNVFTGAGTWNYAYTVFNGSSHGHNVTTETALSTF